MPDETQQEEESKQIEKPRMRALFISTGDASRGMIGEALLASMANERYEAFSAGVKVGQDHVGQDHNTEAEDGQPHPCAVEVMQEVGIDISQKKPISLDEFLGTHAHLSFSKVIVLSETAYQFEPELEGNPDRYYWPFEDPSQVQGSHDDRLYYFRRLREELRSRICLWQEVECRFAQTS